MRKQKVSAVVYEILRLSTIGNVLNASGKELLRVTHGSIVSAIPSLTHSVFEKSSPLKDTFLSMKDMARMFENIQPNIKRLDHIGFCYMVSSQDDERLRIMQTVSETPWHLYDMESVDVAKWYFIGDRVQWQDPMIELLPVVLAKDPPKDMPYWMPHIHLDINTSLSADQIIQVITHIFGDTRKPISYTDPTWGTHCVRMWFGVVSGINIHLDLSTRVRNLEWVRANMLRQIV